MSFDSLVAGTDSRADDIPRRHTGALAFSFDLRRSRLPLATQLEDLTERLVTKAGQLATAKEEYEEIKRRIQERDHIGAEVAALKDQLDALRLEIVGLDEGRRQVEELEGACRQRLRSGLPPKPAGWTRSRQKSPLRGARTRSLTIRSSHCAWELASGTGRILSSSGRTSARSQTS